MTPQSRLHLNTHDLAGGAAKVAWRLAESQRAAGHCARLLVSIKQSPEDHSAAFAPGPDPNLQAECRARGQLYYECQGSHGLADHPLVRTADLLHLHNLHGDYFNPFSLLLLSRFRPLVWTLHDLQAITGHCAHSYTCDRWRSGCGGCPDLSLYPELQVDTTTQLFRDKQTVYAHSWFQPVAPSRWLQAKAEQGIFRDRPVELIYNGVDTEVFQPYDPAKLRQQMNVASDLLLVGCVSNGGVIANHYKGGGYTLAAMQALRRQVPNAVFVNIGAEGESPVPYIINIPPIRDETELARLLATFDIFLFTSLAENCPLSVLEALACGVPVVTFATGGTPELVVHDQCGLVAEYKDGDALAANLIRLAQNAPLRRQFGNRARRRAVEQFDHRRIAAQYEALYARSYEAWRRWQASGQAGDIPLEQLPAVIKTPAFLSAVARLESGAKLASPPPASQSSAVVAVHCSTVQAAVGSTPLSAAAHAPSLGSVDVSIVVATKDRAGLLEAMLASLGPAAAGITYEVIAVVGDCSDATLDILSRHGPVRQFSESEHLGPGRHTWPQLYNYGFGQARGRWVMFASDDILFEPGCLARGFALLERQGLRVAGGIFFYRNRQSEPGWDQYGIDFTYGQNLLLNYGLIRLAAFVEAGGFDESYRFYCADGDLCFKLYERGYDLIPMPGCLVTHDNVLDAQKVDQTNRAQQDIDHYLRRWERWVTCDEIKPRRLLWLEDAAVAFVLLQNALDDQMALACYWLGVACWQQHWFVEAEKHLTGALQAGMRSWSAHWYLALSAWEAGHREVARQALQMVAEAVPTLKLPEHLQVSSPPNLAPTGTLLALLDAGHWREGQPLRLHLGCGEKHFDGYVNIDYPLSEHTCQTRTAADIFADITKLTFPPQSVDEIRLHHVFEHFKRSEALAMVIRWHETLKVGGRLHLETPDLEGCARQLVSNIPFRMKQAVVRHCFGSQEAGWANHYDGWTEERFQHVLSQLGFSVQTSSSSWPHPPHLANVEAIATKLRNCSRAELLAAADRILSEYTVADVASEQGMCGVWRKAMRAFLEDCEPAPVTGVIFSKDRPLQLDATLRSFFARCQDSKHCHLNVLYRASAEFQPLYDMVVQGYPTVTFVAEKDFKNDLLKIVSSSGHVLFVVDDNLFVRDFTLAEVVEVLRLRPEALGFSLRLGRNTTYCYPFNKSQSLPLFETLSPRVLGYNWTQADGDFNYPLELSSSVYRTADVLPLLRDIPFKNPNTLEGELAARVSGLVSRPQLLCFEQSRAFCNPVNVVQRICQNRGGELADYAPARLAQQFREGLRLDVEAYKNFTPTGCHQEVPLHFHRATLTAAPAVSIVIPCYQYAHLLKEAVESVLAQTFQDFEIVVVNDGSPDNTVEVANQLIQKHGRRFRIRLVDQPNSGQPAAARNAGIAVARGAFILPLDADDTLAPEFLAKTVALLQANPDTHIIYTDMLRFGDMDGVCQTGEFTLAKLAVQNQIAYCSLYRREVFDAVGGYNANMVWGGYEDWDFWIGAAERGFKARKLAEPLFRYRIKAGGMEADALKHDAELRARIVLNHPKVYDAVSHAAAVQVWARVAAVHTSEARAQGVQPNEPTNHMHPAPGRILFVSHEASRTGAPIYLLHLLRWLRAKTNLQFRVLLGRGGPLASEFHALAETFTPETLGTDGSRLTDVDLIYSNTCTNGDLINSLACGGVPVVTHVHELASAIEGFGPENFDRIRNHTSHFIACSQAVADGLTQRLQIPADRISVHHGMVSIAELALRAASGSRAEVRLRYGLPERALVIAACGTVVWGKGPDLFLQLATLLQRRFAGRKPLHFVWIGLMKNDDLGQSLRRDCAQRGLTEFVHFVGAQENPHALLNACDLFCLPSRGDAFPLVMLEAGALNKPFVCFDGSGGAKEFAARGAGFAVPYLDVPAMVGRFAQLIEDEPLRQRTGSAAGKLVREDFDVEVSAPRVWARLQSLFYRATIKDLQLSVQLAQQLTSARAAAAAGEKDRAIRLYLDALGSAQKGNNPIKVHKVILDIARAFLPLDQERGRSLLALGEQLARFIRSPEALQAIEELMAEYQQKPGLVERPEIQRREAKAPSLPVVEPLAEANCVRAGGKVSETPAVSIIIPVFNNLALTRACLKSLANTITPVPSEIIVADNGSTDGTMDFLKAEEAAGRLRIVGNAENLGFARACNQGAKAARGQYVLFLNNDTEVQAGWLDPLVSLADADATAAAVGSKLLFPDGTLQHAGVAIGEVVGRDPLLAVHAFYKASADLPEANQRRVYQALTAACLLVRKSAFEEVGGFDEGFWNGYEDVDLCFRLQEKGWLSVYEPASVVIHRESQSGPARFQKVRENIRRLHQKWLGKVKLDVIVSADGVVTQAATTRIRPYEPRTAGTTGTSILILTHNQLAHTKACLESIAQHTPEPYELILVDNGSTDGTPEYLRKYAAQQERVSVIANQTNRGFAAGNNQGLALAKGRQVLLLNNDTVVTPGWLGRLLAVFKRHPDTGVVGPMSNRVSGPQLVNEVSYEALSGLPAFAEEWTQANAGQSFEIGRVVGFCLLARREVIEHIGGLDERFGSGNFEDDDFCIRARLAGFRSRIAKDVFIHHTGSQTFKGAKIDYRSAMLRNWGLFRTKWQFPAEVVAERGYPFPQRLPAGVALKVPLPVLNLSHEASGDGRCWSDKSGKLVPAEVVKAKPVTLPPCALQGHLAEARQFLREKKFPAAWGATRAALKHRPFHPEAYLLLAEIAQAAQEPGAARSCAEFARHIAPEFRAAKKFLKGKFYGHAKHDWLVLPEEIGKHKSERRHHLSVCLIVKNEEQFLDQCLKSVKGLADQIVVVDTGSTDRTVDIAKEHGAQVHSFAWCDDFSAARNAALEHATGDWILMLDADEELPSEGYGALRKLLRTDSVMAWRLPIIDVGREDEGCCYVPRLFRNAPGLFYVGRIHEQVFGSLETRRQEWGLENRLGDAALRHHGYRPDVVKDRNKIERNLRLLEQAVAESPDDPNLVMNHGLELTRSGSLDAGVEQYQRAFEILSRQPAGTVVPELREMLLTQMSTHLMAQKWFNEIVRVLASPLAAAGGLTASLHFNLGLAYFELKQFSGAAGQMRQCLAKRNQPALAPINQEIRKAGPHHCLALCLDQMGETDAAAEEFRLAIEADPQSRSVRCDHARFLAAHERQADALNLLFALANEKPSEAQVWLQGGQLALSRPEFLEVALDWTTEAARNLPDDPAVVQQQAEALMLAGRSDEALPLWRRGSPAANDVVAAALVICETVAGQNQFAPVLVAEVAVSREFVKWYQKLLQFNARLMVEALNANVETLEKVLPTAARILADALAEANETAADAPA